MGMPEKPNDSRLVRAGKNRKTNEETWQVCLGPTDTNALNEITGELRLVRKACVKERQEWLEIKKAIKGPDARFAKDWDRRWLRREKACTILIGHNEGDTPEDWQPYYWPTELAPAIEWALGEASLNPHSPQADPRGK